MKKENQGLGNFSLTMIIIIGTLLSIAYSAMLIGFIIYALIKQIPLNW